jgi:hypothetical protein
MVAGHQEVGWATVGNYKKTKKLDLFRFILSFLIFYSSRYVLKRHPDKPRGDFRTKRTYYLRGKTMNNFQNKKVGDVGFNGLERQRFGKKSNDALVWKPG